MCVSFAQEARLEEAQEGIRCSGSECPDLHEEQVVQERIWLASWVGRQWPRYLHDGHCEGVGVVASFTTIRKGNAG